MEFANADDIAVLTQNLTGLTPSSLVSSAIFQSVFNILLLAGTMATQHVQQQQQQQHTGVELTRSIAGFTRDLYDQYSREKPDENVFFSPISIATVLGMTLGGAKRNTARQLAEALKLPPDDKSVHAAFEKLLSSVNSTEAKYNLTTANNMFVDIQFRMLDSFTKLTQSSYKSGLTNVNFRGDTEGARHTINDWVEKKTDEKIKDLFPSGALSHDDVLVLVNAIYFKANWQEEFDPYDTMVRPFVLSNGEEVRVNMMSKTERYLLGNLPDLECQVLELPYRGKQLSMFILPPNRIDGLADLEKRLTPDVLMTAQNAVSHKGVQVSLPKFKIEFTSEMSKTLQQLGIKDMFLKGVADLTGIADIRPGKLFVSSVVHKSFINVDEKGTEAAAATGVVFTMESAMISNFEFNANHPFLFFIQHKATGAILFIGRLTKPDPAVQA